MDVQPRFFPHDLLAGASSFFFLDGHDGCAPAAGNNTALSELPRSELTCNDNYGFVPRKRARVAPQEPGLIDCAQQQAAQMLVLPGNTPCQSVCSGAAPSTSGRAADASAAVLSHGLLSQLYNQGLEMDALIRVETERMRTEVEEARRRHARAVLATVERAAAARLRSAEAELERARYRSAELEERLWQMSAEGQAWLDVAKSHEAVAAGLRATLDQLLQSGGAVEGAQSCCYEAPVGDDDAASRAKASSCKACGEGEACVLILPCRHLSLCRACEAAVDSCPVCAATKNASLHVLLS